MGLKYLGGHPKLPGPADYIVTREGNNVVFQGFQGGFKLKTLLSIPRANFIGGGDFEKAHTRSAGKAAAGAVVGTVLAGPLAGIMGAAIGGRSRARNTITIPVLDEQGRQHNLLFSGTEKDYSYLLGLIYG